MTESFSTRLNDAMALRELKQIDFVHAAEKFNIKLGKSHMSQYVSGKPFPVPISRISLPHICGSTRIG